ncbi:hypothetical protein W5Q_04458 [Candida albicans SC5314]|nr:hypothetical protein MG9_04368 [Candida albicans P37037]KGT67009.1 hypothetical protein MEK_04381 [Candida albicans 12C]KHC75330.1 hypothetical protein W5Q_04458 [Candida albicans SC5314]
MYKDDLSNSLKMILYRTLIDFPKDDVHIFALMSTGFVMNSVVGKLDSSLTSKLPNYGKKFDKQSYWIVEKPNRKPDDPVLIYLHGGGYFLGIVPQQIESMVTTYYLLDASKRENLSILVLDYNLTCQGYPIPHQLSQLVETYSNLVKNGAENLLLMGDSAGGNLAVTFTQYLRLSNSVNLPYPKSCVLISPWVKLIAETYQNTPGHSYYNYSKVDMLHFDTFSSADLYKHILGDTKLNSLTVSPGNCPYDPKDWDDISIYKQPGHSVFVLAGEHETFRDDILEWSKCVLDYPIDKLDFKDSNGEFDPKAHRYIRNDANSAYVDITIVPWGPHDYLYFDHSLIGKLKSEPTLKLNSINKRKYFATISVVNFLNTVLPGKN